ncbi:alpha-protein kinase 1 [Scleropages formosus]|uniref:Alpha kinase 1 n=1 Tax=Scleropages formosus TaxID=113540 RepID=A0A8C9RTL1_SCLFO|nr:alpha-protein kinase 1 [Scleropages formosus]
MNNQDVVWKLEECRAAVLVRPGQPAEEDKEEFQKCWESLPVELSVLLQEAVAMMWPFVPEKWQYKQSVNSEDKTNLKDLISQHLSQLLAFLKACILVGDSQSAVSVVFLMDRFLYWTDASNQLLRIIKALHKYYPDTPIAPQVVIRQARLSVSSGKLQKAEYILSSLINNSGETGCWKYHVDSDRVLVQSVSVQIRGQVLQKLGLWREAAELMWASLVGFFALPQPDKKGIGASLGLFANILVSMNDKDFHTFKTSPHIDLCFLKEKDHRLLSAAEAAKMSVVYSQYTPLYVLSNVVTQGTCLLSYSFSPSCSNTQREAFLIQAKEAFEIGLLTKTDEEAVPSKLELHLFTKAAYSLAVTHRWLGSPAETVYQAWQVSREAMELLDTYSLTDGLDRDRLSREIMCLVSQVKTLFHIHPFLNSEDGSFIPDSYRSMEKVPVRFSFSGFFKVMENFTQYHASVCEAFETSNRMTANRCEGSSGVCITALKTATETPVTECTVKIPNLKKSSGPEGKRQEKQKEGGNLEQHGERCEVPLGLFKHKVGPQPSEQEFSSPHLMYLPKQELCCNALNGQAAENSTILIDTQCPTEDCEEEGQSRCFKSTIPRSTYTGQVILMHDCREDLQSSSSSKNEGLSSQSSWHKMSSSGSLSDSLGSQSSWQKISDAGSFSMTGNGSDLIAEDVHGWVDMSCVTEISENGEQGENDHFGPQATCKVKNVGNKEIHRYVTSQNREKIEKAVDMLCLTEASTEDDVMELRGSNIVYEATSRSETQQSNGCKKRSKSSSSSLSDSLSSVSSWQKISFSETASSLSTGDGSGKEALVDEGVNGWVDMSCPTDMSEDDKQSSWTEISDKPTGPIHHSSDKVLSHPLCLSTETDSSFELVDKNGDLSKLYLHESTLIHHQYPVKCLQGCMIGAEIPEEPCTLTKQDYIALLSGVCHECLLKRLRNTGIFKLRKLRKAYSALLMKYSKASGLWISRETMVYIGDPMGKQGMQRAAFWVQFLHQEELLGKYVGKEYLSAKELHYHFNDVERQMTAQHYVTEFNKRLYEKRVAMQIFFIPSEVLLILEDNVIVGCMTVEPYMLGDFVKLTNNTTKVVRDYKATDYGIAFGHFTFEFSGGTEVVVDLQGWVTGNGKGLTYLTDPQIHSLKTPGSRTNFGERGIRNFLEAQHGLECNDICKKLSLGRLHSPGEAEGLLVKRLDL